MTTMIKTDDSRPLILEGKVHVLLDLEGNVVPDIDTDMIYHNAHLAVTDMAEMGQYALGNLDGWHDFPDRAEAGDIIVAGRNFGAGSSRQQAVDCFRSLGVRCVIAESFGAIYWRNAVNSGFAVLTCPGILTTGENGTLSVADGDIIRIQCETGKITNVSRKILLPSARPFSAVQKGIYLAGNLFRYGSQE